jgi:uncharacterized membrane protein YphA (DoxX/SURF4 family)
VKTDRIVYVLATGLVAVAFAGSGLANLLRADHVANDMLRLGYPGYFMSVLGTWKVLGAVTVALPKWPRLKEWAYAGMCFDLTGAAASRAITHHGLASIVAPLLILAAVLASWWLRPGSRTLQSPTTPA